MRDEKKISDVQELGYIGESEFANWANKVGYFPTKIIPDHGIDFVCQVKGSKTHGKASSTMQGKIFLATVRSMEEDGQGVTLSRADANLLLEQSLLVLAIVKRARVGDSGQISIRFVDESFIRELHSFLCTTYESHLVRFDEGHTHLDAIRYNFERLFRRNYQEKIAHLKAELKLGEVLKGPHLRVVSDSSGGYSVVISSDFLDQFDIGAPDIKDRLCQAVFGRSELFGRRLSSLPMHPTVQNVIEDLPGPVLIAGALQVAGGRIELEAINSRGRTRVTFECRFVADWFGYSHESGVYLRISKPVHESSQHFHYIETGSDPDTLIERLCEGDIAPFLKRCVGDDAKIIVCGTGLELNAGNIPNLCTLGWLVKRIEVLSSSAIINTGAWRIADLQDEDLCSLGFLSDLYANHSMLDGFSFTFCQEAFDQLAKLPVEMEIPICMNIRQQGIVCWLKANGIMFGEAATGTLVGLQLVQALSLRFENVGRSFPTKGSPHLKIFSVWPAIPLHDNEVIFNGEEDWGVALSYRRT